jgi:5-(carboxyamino)imidazole ribonucleotide synthase
MTRDRLMVAPGGWIGLLGGGQLGRMFAMAAQSLGYRVAVLDPANDGPAASVADEHIEADYLDAPALESLALQCAAVTTEFENVPAQSLAFLAEHCFTTPSAESVAVAQDRIAEKSFIASCGIAVVPHAVIETAADLHKASDDLFPAILKASRLGYDGKGQARVANRGEAQEAFVELGSVSCVLEKRVDLAFELSVVVARGVDGGTVIYAPAENLHRNGILIVTTVPSMLITPTLEADAVAATLRIAHALDYVGVLCVEFFVAKSGPDGKPHLLVNEIAPRPHNSGHYTIDACITSQFSQQARIAAGLPLGETRRHSAAVMLNLLGDLWFMGEDAEEMVEPDWAAVCKQPGANLHLYAKREARRGRKMGHVTIVADRSDEAKRVALEIADVLGIERW